MGTGVEAGVRAGDAGVGAAAGGGAAVPVGGTGGVGISQLAPSYLPFLLSSRHTSTIACTGMVDGSSFHSVLPNSEMVIRMRSSFVPMPLRRAVLMRFMVENPRSQIEVSMA